MAKDVREDESINYRWTFSSSMQQLQTAKFHIEPNLRLVPHPSDDGVYTCYANTASGFTIESQGVNTTLTVLREYTCMYKRIHLFPLLLK